MNKDIFIVDDDSEMREILSALCCQAGYPTMSFTDGRSFVHEARHRTPACVLLDIHMPGPSGLEILDEIGAKTYPAPILIVSGRDDVLSVVQAMRKGAFDYIEKDQDGSAIVARIVDAIEMRENMQQRLETRGVLSCTFRGYDRLTPRERQVLAHIVTAASNKQTAISLGISWRTVEVHRAKIMQKLGAKNSIDLMRIVTNATDAVMGSPAAQQA